MIIVSLIGIPFGAGILSFFIGHDRLRRALLIISAALHLAITGYAWTQQPADFCNGWFALDGLAVLFLAITSVLFFGTTIYGIRYLAGEKQHDKTKSDKESLFCNTPEAIFTGCLLLFLATMTTIVTSQHFGVMWVAVEATTLASAPLIYFHRNKRSLEATWKYLLICSVGIALALLGIFFLAAAQIKTPGGLLLKEMTAQAATINVPWLKAAFLCIFVGYGTKMGLAPFHTWLPDAHSEAPSVVSALLSGALLNCAFLGIVRVYEVCIAAGLLLFCRDIFILFGLISILFAAFFIVGQRDYKRMLAYSSIEHMGMIILAIGLGGQAVFGGLLLALSHALTKAGLFLVAGNILAYYRTKTIGDVHGLLAGAFRRTGLLWFAGFLLITGTPPSGIFFGKLIILKTALEQGRYILAALIILAIAIIFIGMVRIVISMVYGNAKEENRQQPPVRENFFQLFPSAIFFALVVSTGIFLPAWMTHCLTAAAQQAGGGL